MIVLASWAVGLVVGGISLGVAGHVGPRDVPARGAVLGSGLGGVQVADRVLMVRLSPPEQLGEFFGLYGLVGKGSQVIGQLLYGVDPARVPADRSASAAYQIAVLSLLVTMLIGAWLIRPVSDRWSGSGEVAIEAAAGAARAGDRAARAEVRPAQSSKPAGWRRRQAQAEPIISSRVDRVGRQPSTSRGPIDGRDEDRRVAGSRRGPMVYGIGTPDDALGRGDDLADAEPAAAAEVADERRVRSSVARRGRLEREEVGVGEVRDVDVVADAASRRASGSRRRRASAGARCRRPRRGRSG